MFYSQFILAKKGTLGTIWIAAHLERKLRKNQVADTDIGDSVDSILFPDVPIALRLSSHLLLGVVRIYSRKVNYLFDDCSEALLKVKQAFRSTAVDLPPEESTAPYHSITLPETFDLDDFELPDSDILQGNYVDHHVSTREQITLQDTMEGVVYSTSQFGLDERFGDGGTSGLDLDEEIFLTKVAASRHAGDMPASDAEPHVSVQTMSPLELNKNHEEINGNPKAMVAPDRVNQLDGLAGNTDYIEYAQAPCTPGLLEEPNLSKTQEASAYDDQLELVEEPNFSNIQEASASDYNLESEDHNITNFAAKENMISISSNLNIQLKSRVDSPSTAGNSVLAEPVRFTIPGSESSYRNYTAFDSVNGLPDLQNGIDINNEPGSCSIDGANADIVERVNLDETLCPSFSNEVHAGEDFSRALFSGIENNCVKSLSSTCEPISDYVSETNQVAVTPEVPNNAVNAGNMENQWPTSNSVSSNVESPGRENLEIPEKNQACQDLEVCELLSSNVDEKLTAAKIHVLQPCKHLNQLSMLNYGCDVSAGPLLPSGVLGTCSAEISEGKEAPHAAGASTDIQGERCNAPDFMELHFNDNKITEPASNVEIQTDNSKCNEVDMILGESRKENIAGSENFELPSPEKLLCVPEGLADLQENFMDSTPYLLSGGGGVSGININSGKKRSITESTLTMHSLNSVELMAGARSKRTKEYISDDADLLASILVGRSSVLKIVPTPVPQPRITRMKRQQSAPRSASKRKVLMDDAMILHGDVIRQQLTSTEDIRRTRKKAPCIRPEIWMIQKEFLEDEIFSEPVFTGYSEQLVLLHSQTYDLSKIRISQNDAYNPLLEDATKQNAGLLKDETNALKAANNMTFSVRPNVDHNSGMEWTNESLVGGNHVKASHSGNLQAEDHVSQLPGNETPLQMDAICDVRVPENIKFGIESASSSNFGMGYEKEISAHFTLRSALFDKETAGNRFVRRDASGAQDVQSVAMESSIACISSGKGANAPVAEENNVSAAVGGAAEARVRDELLEQTEVGFGSSIDIRTTREANPSLENSSETNFPSGLVVATFGTVEENDDSAAVGGATEARVRDELLEQIEVGFGSSIDMQTTREATPSLEISPETNFPSGQVVATFGTVEENDDTSVVGGATEARVRDELLEQIEVGFGSSIDMQTTREATPSLEISPETNFPSGQVVATFGTLEENDDTAVVGGATEARVRDELLEQIEVGFGSSIDMQTTREATPSLEISPETNFSSGQVVATFGTVEENDDSASVGGAAEAGVRDELLEQTEVGLGSSIDMQTTREANPSLEISPETNFPSGQFVATFGTVEEISNHGQGMLLNGGEVLAPEMVTSYGSIDELKLASSYPVKLDTDVENLSSVDGEYPGPPPGCLEADPHCTMEEAISVADHTATVDCSDTEYTADWHDTGFLNADDDDVADDEEYMPSAEQTSFLENSGWSSRTRAVAKYLKVLFEKEVEHGRKVVQMDNLLVGKTRKEASRMFFEALVLKTRDYIHVEQEAPFEDIKLKPRVMLMKSDL